LSPSITPDEAAESLTLLKSLGLIAMNRDRSWTQVEKTMATDARVKSVMVSQFHREMIRLGGESLSRFPGKDREISGTTLRVAEAELNFQFFPLVKSRRGNGGKSADNHSESQS
jgi:uncharacterized protein (TIGR02147 family)